MPKKKTIKSSKSESNIGKDLKKEVYNLHGDVVGKTSLPKEIFAARVNPYLLTQAVRVYQANQRQGTHSTKTRAEVISSTKKIYRQKGTGRARHGAISAPIFIGGGIAHGPKPRDYSLNLPVKMRRQALFGVLSQKLQNGELKVVKGLGKIETKTKKMYEALVNLKLEVGKNNTLLVTPQDFKNVLLASRNIQNLFVENAKLLNAHKVLLCKNLLLMEESLPVLASRFLPQKPELETSKTTSPQKPVSSKKTAVKIVKSLAKNRNKNLKRKK